MPVNPANLITAARIALAPVLVLLAWRGCEQAFLVCLIASLASDIIDGQIARRWHLATPLGAKLDSWADFLTVLSLPAGLYWLRPELLSVLRLTLILAVASYFLPIAIGFAKFRSLTSYHTFLARVAAYLLGASFVILFAHGPTVPLQLSVAILALAGAEEIGITLVLPRAQANVRSLAKALALRRSLTTSTR